MLSGSRQRLGRSPDERERSRCVSSGSRGIPRLAGLPDQTGFQPSGRLDWAHETGCHSCPRTPGGHAGRAARHRTRGRHRHARRAAASGRSCAGRLHAPPRPAARQQLARPALLEPEARCRELGLHQGAADRPRVRRGRGDPEQAWALPRHPDRDRAEEGHRRQADQPDTFPRAPAAAAICASIQRTVAPDVDGLRARSAGNRSYGFRRATERAGRKWPGSDHGAGMFLLVPQEAAAARRRPAAGDGLDSCRR